MTPIRKTQQVRLERAQARKRLLMKIGSGFIILLAAIWGIRQLPWGQWLVQLQPEQTASAGEAGVTAPDKQAAPTTAEPSTHQPSVEFTFYTVLPKMAVEVDVEPLPVRLKQPVVIVAGTFGEAAYAQRELKRLQQKGFDQISIRVFEKHGRKLYQLRSEPLENKLDVIRLRNRLQKAGASVMVVKLSTPQKR